VEKNREVPDYEKALRQLEVQNRQRLQMAREEQSNEERMGRLQSPQAKRAVKRERKKGPALQAFLEQLEMQNKERLISSGMIVPEREQDADLWRG
jgi:hypothetical protein